MVNQLDRSVTCMRALLHSLSSTFVKDDQLWRYLSTNRCFTDPHCHKPTQSNVTQTHTDTHQPKIMSHRSKIIYLVQLENVRQIVAERLTLEILNNWNCPKMLLIPLSITRGVYSRRKNYVQRLPAQIECCSTLMGARIRKVTASAGHDAHQDSLFPSISLALLLVRAFGHSGT